MEKISDRVYKIIQNEGITIRAFEQVIGCSNGVISRFIKNGNDSDQGKATDISGAWLSIIIEKFPRYDAKWLLTGYSGQESKKEKREYEIENDFNLATDSIKEIQQVPLYDMEAVAGLVPLFNEATKQTPIDYIKIPNLPKCDGAIYITGDSMYPLLKSGDIVLYKQVVDVNNGIFWGEMYLISIDMAGEEYVTVKYIQKSELPDHVRLVSHNQHHDDKDILLSSIRALAFVKASIRINSMK